MTNRMIIDNYQYAADHIWWNSENVFVRNTNIIYKAIIRLQSKPMM